MGIQLTTARPSHSDSVEKKPGALDPSSVSVLTGAVCATAGYEWPCGVSAADRLGIVRRYCGMCDTFLSQV